MFYDFSYDEGHTHDVSYPAEPCWSKKYYSDSKNQWVTANLAVFTCEILKLIFAVDTLWSNRYFLMSMKYVYDIVFFLYFPFVC